MVEEEKKTKTQRGNRGKTCEPTKNTKKLLDDITEDIGKLTLSSKPGHNVKNTSSQSEAGKNVQCGRSDFSTGKRCHKCGKKGHSVCQLSLIHI